jgi:hypothetical protein
MNEWMDMEQWYNDAEREREKTEVLAEICPGATSCNIRPTGTDLLWTADIPSEPSKPGSVPQLPLEFCIFAWFTNQTIAVASSCFSFYCIIAGRLWKGLRYNVNNYI